MMNLVASTKKMFPFALAVVSLILTIASLVLSVAYLVYRITSERAYREKWKDYNDCGLA